MRLRPVLYRPWLDDAARLQDLEIKLLEERQWRGEGADEEHDREQRNQHQQRPVKRAADERDEHGRDDSGLVDLERGVVYDLGCHPYFSIGALIELPHSVHEPS